MNLHVLWKAICIFHEPRSQYHEDCWLNVVNKATYYRPHMVLWQSTSFMSFPLLCNRIRARV